MANQEPARAIADRFDITRSSCNRVFRRVVMAAVGLSNEYIRWPTGEYHRSISKRLPIIIHLTGNKILEISTSFEDEGRFPGVIGLIDGTHIRIRVPENEPEAYINRKKFHSLNVQVELKKCFSLNEPTLLLLTL